MRYHRRKAARWQMRREKASYTVEASILVPIFIATMVLAMKMGMSCYEEIRDQQEQQTVCEMWEVKEFYRYQKLKEIVHD